VAAKGIGYLRHNLLGALALFIALGGTSYAATGGFSQGGTLKACVNEEGRVKLLKAGGHCKRGQSAVAWNQAGLQGVKGTTGATGATGAAGAAGAQGPNGADGESAAVKWGVIGGHAELGAAQGVVEAVENPAHFYEVTFDSDITNCALTADSNDLPGLAASLVRNGTKVAVHFFTTKEEGVHLTDFSIVAYC